MKRAIGFRDFPKGWEGPVELELSLDRPHTKTARYVCELETRPFQFYCPHFLLSDKDALPEKIVVALGKARNKMSAMGFHAVQTKPVVSGEMCEFDYDEKKVHSHRYNAVYDGQSYNLYVPNEIFGGDEPPKKLFVAVL